MDGKARTILMEVPFFTTGSILILPSYAGEKIQVTLLLDIFMGQKTPASKLEAETRAVDLPSGWPKGNFAHLC